MTNEELEEIYQYNHKTNRQGVINVGVEKITSDSRYKFSISASDYKDTEADWATAIQTAEADWQVCEAAFPDIHHPRAFVLGKYRYYVGCQLVNNVVKPKLYAFCSDLILAALSISTDHTAYNFDYINYES